MPSQLTERMPYVTFERRAIEDRTRSEEAGHYCAKDVDFAIITPAGSRDRIERQVDEWFLKLKDDALQGRCPEDWPEAFKKRYESYKQNNEVPEDGTSVKVWPVASPAQIATLLAIGVRTVEDLAVCNEETIMRLGMGGRALREKAVTWLNESKDIGVSVVKMAGLQAEIDAEKTRNKALESQVAEMRGQVELLLRAQAQTSAPSQDSSISADDLGLGTKL
jgi:hypothetical protein